jgi:3D (Asp-Asp-Asp) domain-containing protein
MLIARSLRRKIVATLVVIAGFVVFYEATIFDSRFSTRQLLRISPPTAPETGTSQGDSPEATVATAVPAIPFVPALPPVPALRFAATAYCRGTMTASGVTPRTGIAAADEDLLPVGSVIQVGLLGPRYDGVYTVMDTGPKVQGRNIDLYIWNCDEAVKFGRRAVTVVVLRLGWNPRDTSPTLFDRLLGWGERTAQRALPGRKR